jgi:hypothetical protein
VLRLATFVAAGWVLWQASGDHRLWFGFGFIIAAILGESIW